MQPSGDRVKGVGLGFERQAAGGSQGTKTLLNEVHQMKKKAHAENKSALSSDK